MAIAAVTSRSAVADDLVAKIAERIGCVGDARRRRYGSADHVRILSTLVPRRRRRRAPISLSTDGRLRRRADGFLAGATLRSSRPTCRCTPTRSSDPVAFGGSGRQLRRHARARERPYGNGTIFTNDGGAARFAGEVMVQGQRLHPVPSRITRSAAGRAHCSATATRTAPTACTSSPVRRSSRVAGSTRATAASTSASRAINSRTLTGRHEGDCA